MSDGISDPAATRRAEPTPAEQRSSLKALLAKRAAQVLSAPLSAGQERLWALEALDPGNRVYVETGSIRFSAHVDLSVVQRAADEIVRRHAILRTTFGVEDGRPVQRIARERSLRLESDDLRGVPPGEHDATLRALLLEMSQRPFDFACGPLLRCKLVRLGEKDHVIFVAIHHIVCDGFSIRLLLTELFEYYVAYRMGQPASLPALAAQYVDFARWQRRWLASDAIEPELDYWRRALASPLAVVELPPDRPRRAERRFRGAQLRIRISDAVHAGLRARAIEQNATPFMFLLAAFDLLLHAYTGQEDVIVAVPVAGRNRPEYERVVGFFVNTLLLRCDLSGDPSFRELLARVRKTTLGAMAHQEVPVERIVGSLNLPRSPGHSSLVRAAFALHPAWTDHLHAPGYDVEVLDLDSGTSRMELTLLLWQGRTALTGTLEYDTDLYDASTVERFADHYARLLEALVRDPDRRISAGLPIDALESGAVAERRERWRREVAAPTQVPVRSLAARDPDAELEDLCLRTNLTRNQMLVWLGQRAQPELPLYNMPAFFHLSVDVEVEAFRSALQAVVDASEVLRTVFDEIDGLPRRRVLPRFALEFPVHDLSREPDPGVALEAFVATRRDARLDASRPLFETALIVLGPRRSVWYFNQHHLIGDGGSAALILGHVDALYARARTGGPLALELPAFDDFVREERARRGTPRWERARQHWRAALAEPPPPLWFCARALATRTTRVRRTSFPLGVERSTRLLAAARALGGASEGELLFHAAASALLAWLHRTSGNRRLAIGTPLRNRVGRSHKATPGLFMQVAPLALTVAPEDTLRTLAHKVARELRTAMRHQLYATANSPERPFYEVGFNVHVAQRAFFFGAPMHTEWSHTGHEHEALALQIRDFDGSGEFTLDFDAREDRFDAAEARRGARQLVAVLDALIANPDLPVSALEILDADERRHLIVDLNRTSSVRAEDVIELFRHAVDRFPTRAALVDGDDELSYAELEARANRLANHLIANGVGPGDSVALLAARSADYVVGVLGVLAAGAAYVPIDPAHPEQRIASMIARSGSHLVLVQQSCADRVRDLAIPRVALDGRACPWSSNSAERSATRGLDARVGYVVFTSGSTGRPHAVVVSAASLAHYAVTAAELFALEPSDRVLQFAALSFDTAVEEIFPTLISGATLVLRDEAMIVAPEKFLTRCGERGISIVNLPTSYWNAVVDRTPPERRTPDSIRLVVVGGERILPERLGAWRRGPGRGLRLLNGYGPTETTVVATFADLSDLDSSMATDSIGSCDAIASAVSIGRPIADARVYILDEELRLLPEGAVGELWIGGAGVALGYLDEPELSAERFRPDPFGPPGARLYRSGDLCRWGDSGELQFLGRVDAQIKLGGFRVEPGEVEAALIAQASVRDAGVAAREDGGRARLIAWVEPMGDAVDRVELSAALRARLPEHMIPSSIVAVACLPRYPNGKVDREALLALADDRAEDFVVARDARERALAAIWCQAFGLERVSVSADFFDLGGDSLLAIRVVLLAQGAGIPFTPQQLFAHRTIAALAAAPPLPEEVAAPEFAAAAETVDERCALVDLAPGATASCAQRAGDVRASAAPVFVFHGAGGDLRPYRFLVRELAAAVSLVGIESSLPAGPRTAHDSIAAMARDYCDLVRGRQPHGPYYLLGWSMGGLLAFETARVLEAQGEEVRFLGLLDDSSSAAPDLGELDAAALAARIGDLMHAAYAAPDLARGSESDTASVLAALEGGAAQLIEALGRLPAADRARTAAAWLSEQGWVSPNAPAAPLEAQLRRFEQHGALCADYRLAPVRAAIHRWYTADTDRREPPPALADAALEVVGGNHYTMLFPPHVSDLALRIRRALANLVA